MRRVGFENTWGRGIRTKLCGSLLVVCTALIVGTAPPSFAQGNVSVAADTPGAAGGNIPPNGEISPTGEYKEGLAVGRGCFIRASLLVASTTAILIKRQQAPTRIPVGARAWLRA